MRNLLPELSVDGVDFVDLLQIFSSYFGRSVQSETETEFQRDIDAPAVRIRHSAKGKISAIEPLAHWQECDLDALRTAIVEFQAYPGTVDVTRRYTFTDLPIVDHALGVEDWFTFLPVPSDAPKEPLMYGRFPAMIEVAYSKRKNEMVNMRSRQRVLTEIELLLNVLYKWGVRAIPNSSREWGVPAGSENSTNVPFHVLYSWPGSISDGGGFSDIEPYRGFLEVPPERYYFDEPAVSRNGQIQPQIGSDFPGLLSNYRKLSPSLQTRFLAAAYWFQYSDKVQCLSQSASFLALVQTIEALIDPGDNKIRCSTCGHLPGAVKQFHNFVERYAAQTPKKLRDEIYRMRSRIVHGGHQLRADAAMHDMHPGQLTEMSQRRALGLIVRLMLRNWLADSGGR